MGFMLIVSPGIERDILMGMPFKPMVAGTETVSSRLVRQSGSGCMPTLDLFRGLEAIQPVPGDFRKTPIRVLT